MVRKMGISDKKNEELKGDGCDEVGKENLERKDGGEMVRWRVVSSGTCLGFMHIGSGKWV